MLVVATLLIVVGGVVGLSALLAALQLGAPDGFAFASGAVVEADRPGKRPTVIEFVPAGATAPVRFKYRERFDLGRDVIVRYSEAAPENASVVASVMGTREKRTRIAVTLLVALIGAVVVVLGVRLI